MLKTNLVWLMVAVALAELAAGVGVCACNLFSTSTQVVTTDDIDDSSKVLRRIAEDAIKAAKDNDDQKLLEITASMVMPNPAEWFGRVFGPNAGAVMGGKYAAMAAQAPASLARDFKVLAQQHLTSVEVDRFVDSCNDSLDEHLYPVLSARKVTEPLSWLKFGYGDNAKILKFFAFMDGAFRFVGRLDSIPYSDEPVDGFVDSPPIVKGAAITPARRLDHVQLVYPQDARNRHIQGQVKLHLVIGKDGKTYNIHVLSGVCPLAEAAVQAVAQFRYTPSTINGASVAVDTTVEVYFSLSATEFR